MIKVKKIENQIKYQRPTKVDIDNKLSLASTNGVDTSDTSVASTFGGRY
jgi:hypothetical protein